jgi:hypothetical protein
LQHVDRQRHTRQGHGEYDDSILLNLAYSQSTTFMSPS